MGIHPKKLIKLKPDDIKRKFKERGPMDLETLALFTVYLENRR
jgi:hypothetical protein